MHHDQIINGEKVTNTDIVSPSYGSSRVTPSICTDPAFHEYELLQNIALKLVTKGGKEAIKTENRVFRLQNGKWSIWDADSNGVAVDKFMDLTLGNKVLDPVMLGTGRDQEAMLTAEQQPWVDEENEVNYLSFDGTIGEGVHWQIYRRVSGRDWFGSVISVMMQGDEYLPRGARFRWLVEEDGFGEWCERRFLGEDM